MKYKDIPEMNKEQIDRFFSNIEKTETCWLWIGRRSLPGYGIFKFNQKEYYSHRISYHIQNKSLSNTLVLDHICRNRNCVKPDHLRQVTISVNSSENTYNPLYLNSLKTHCKHGHEFTLENTFIRKDGRRCRTCKRNDEKGRARKRKCK